MQAKDNKRLATLTLAALGIVYGDIGTSPLYSIKEVFGGAHHPVPITPDNVLGILSLFFWSLIIVVTLKYVAFIMRANNKGEGGIIALMTLALHNGDPASGDRRLLITLGLFGAALFYGDGVITPAISVLSAVEGLEIITPAFKPYILPITLVILVGLFFSSAKGTASVGAMFGPVMMLWFAVLAVLGGIAIIAEPFGAGCHQSLFTGSISCSAIRCSASSRWAQWCCALPAPRRYMPTWGISAPNRFNTRGWAMCCRHCSSTTSARARCCWPTPSAVENPFYLLAPEWALYPLVILATIATVIASQAVISGAFSITRQAIQLGYTPRLECSTPLIRRSARSTCRPSTGCMLLSIIALVLGFGTSSNLAAAYGIAVTGTMLITNLLAIAVAVRLWHWSPLRAVLGALPFILSTSASSSPTRPRFPMAAGSRWLSAWPSSSC
jgi:KUP system potassium uptake protein